MVYNIENQLSSGLCPSSWIKYIKSRRFGGWFFFHLQVMGGETPEDGKRTSLRNIMILSFYVFYPG
jgi:hypothetical protein